MSRTVSALKPSMTSWMPLAKKVSSTSWSLVSSASRPSLRARLAYSTMRSISSEGVGALLKAVTIITLAMDFTSSIGKLTIVTAIVPPHTMMSEGTWMKMATPPGPVAIEKSTRPNARRVPKIVATSMGGYATRGEVALVSLSTAPAPGLMPQTDGGNA